MSPVDTPSDRSQNQPPQKQPPLIYPPPRSPGQPPPVTSVQPIPRTPPPPPPQNREDLYTRLQKIAGVCYAALAVAGYVLGQYVAGLSSAWLVFGITLRAFSGWALLGSIALLSAFSKGPNNRKPAKTVELNKPRFLRRLRRALVLLFVMAVLILASSDSLVHNAKLSLWFAIPLGLIVLIAGLLSPFIVVSFVAPRGLANWFNLIRSLYQIPIFLLRSYTRVDLAVARRAAKSPGHLSTHADHLTIWTEDAQLDADHIAHIAARARDRFCEITGTSARFDHLDLWCFAHRDAFQRYARPLGSQLPHAAGFYLQAFRHCRRAVIDGDVRSLPGETENTIAHELAHHLLRQIGIRHPSDWADEGIAQRIGNKPIGRRFVAASRDQRCLQILRQREVLLAPDILAATTTYARRFRSAAQVPDAYWALFSFYRQSAWLAAYLFDRQPEAARNLTHWTDTRNPAGFTRFQSCFHLTFQQAVEYALASIESQPVSPHEAPPDRVRHRIDNMLLPELGQTGATEKRRYAIRELAGRGYLWRAHALIDILANENDPLRLEAQWALQLVTGKVFDDSEQLSCFKTCLDKLPPAVTGEHH